MRKMWCWHCRRDVAMLDEDEYAQIKDAYVACVVDSREEHRADDNAGSSGDPRHRVFAPARALYSAMTGEAETSLSEILEHRLSNLGPPCKTCGKPLRTPRARVCAECWATV